MIINLRRKIISIFSALLFASVALSPSSFAHALMIRVGSIHNGGASGGSGGNGGNGSHGGTISAGDSFTHASSTNQMNRTIIDIRIGR